MAYDVVFNYRVEKEAQLGVDENNTPCEIYVQIKIEGCNGKRNLEMEKHTHNGDGKRAIAEQLNIPIDYVTPISQEEYDANN